MEVDVESEEEVPATASKKKKAASCAMGMQKRNGPKSILDVPMIGPDDKIKEIHGPNTRAKSCSWALSAALPASPASALPADCPGGLPPNV
ncbi:hypothetical protein FRC09_010740 [Ceratobasidium sp. 395]|nr:hypothetical protein FRC09_010740 [Ceratobasidium sp. 395]